MDKNLGSPYDINNAGFNAELYVQKVLKVIQLQKLITLSYINGCKQI